MLQAFLYVSMYEVHALAAVPSILIPKPAGFLVLNMSKPKVQALCSLHSFNVGDSESHAVSRVGVFGSGRLVGCHSCARTSGSVLYSLLLHQKDDVNKTT